MRVDMSLGLNDIRKGFLNYFVKNDHREVRSSPLVPQNDPTLMFVNSGMVQFKNVFTGLDKRDYVRATSSQRCIRAGGKHNDLENVGYTARHHTFFEMLGNFSFGDYFKEEAIYYSWELLTKDFGLPKDKLYATIYHTDDEAYNYWKKISGFSDDRIIRIKTTDNFWSMGDTGPCGPCSEIFYDHGDHIFGGLPGTKDQDGDRYIEIWNMVFMQYEQIDKDTRIDLPKQSIDTGMGLERLAAVLQGVHDNYDTDLFKSLISASESISGKKSDNEFKFSHRIIADHLRSSAFLIADGVMPSNEGRGYVLRRIMRRAMCQAHLLGMKDPMMHLLVSELVNLMGAAYPELIRAEDLVRETLKSEEERFKTTLDRGLKLLDEEINQNADLSGNFSGDVAFKLYDTFGFPLDLTQAILRPKNFTVDVKAFDHKMEEQKEKARKAWAGSGESKTDAIWFELYQKYGATEFLGYSLDKAEGKVLTLVRSGKEVKEVSEIGDTFLLLANQTPFYGESGGQMGDIGKITSDSEIEIEVTDTKKYLGSLNLHSCILKKGKITQDTNIILEIDVAYRNNLRKHHSATHILHFVMRKVLGAHISQKGSLVAHDKLRFDISHNKQISRDEIVQIEQMVNSIIMQNVPSSTKLMSIDEAMNSGAMALFGEKYDEEVRVVRIGDESVELCGGTHVKYAGDIGLFKITSESAIAAGVRRIEAVCGFAALEYLQKSEELISLMLEKLNVPSCDLSEKIDLVLRDNKNLEKELSHAKFELSKISEEDYKKAIKLGVMNVALKLFDNLDTKIMRLAAEDATQRFKDLVAIYLSNNDGKLSIIVSVSEELSKNISAADIANKISKGCGGNGGGGKPTIAQSGGVYRNDIKEKALELIS
jgi:alanyl-tRNA synthetase